MAKRNHTIDFITDLQERADHNINPYYWFNRVTPFTLAQWKTEKWFTPLFFVLYSAMGGLLLRAVYDQAVREQRVFWAVLFDFSDSFTTARCVGMLFFSFLWLMMGISTGQSALRGIYAAMLPKPKRNRERKKKHPKRPKNYK